MRKITALAAMAAVLAVGVCATAQAKKVSYKFGATSSFSVTVPDSWEVTPAKEEGDYTNVGSPAGTMIQMRTMDGNEDELAQYIKDANEYISNNYSDVVLKSSGDNCKVNGLVCSIDYGTGKEKDGGGAVKLMSAVIALSDGKIGEIWYVAPVDDKAGIEDAAKIFDSYKSP